MTQAAERQRITSIDSLRELVGVPSERAVNKQLSSLDGYCTAFIERSPFVLLGTSSSDGRCDVSPKGDQPGFVLVEDPRTLVIPDRPGNRRFDSLQNILSNPHVGLLFLIPGMDETLRVNGTAELVRDPQLLDRLAVQGKPPLLAIVVQVDEVFFHCGRSSLRSSVWNPSQYMPRERMPSLSKMIADQTRPAERDDVEHARYIDEAERATAEAYRCLY